MDGVVPVDPERRRFINRRWQEYEGEQRANLLRTIAIGCFYVIHLLHYHQVKFGFLQLDDVPVDRQFHLSVTSLAVAWAMVAFGTFVCLRRRVFSSWLKHITTRCDVLLLTAILYLADGPRSPLIVGYFLIIVLAALRFSLPLVRIATIDSMIGYFCLLGVAKWPQAFGKGDVDISVPRYEQLIFLVALALCGVMLGQVLRVERGKS